MLVFQTVSPADSSHKPWPQSLSLFMKLPPMYIFGVYNCALEPHFFPVVPASGFSLSRCGNHFFTYSDDNKSPKPTVLHFLIVCLIQFCSKNFPHHSMVKPRTTSHHSVPLIQITPAGLVFLVLSWCANVRTILWSIARCWSLFGISHIIQQHSAKNQRTYGGLQGTSQSVLSHCLCNSSPSPLPWLTLLQASDPHTWPPIRAGRLCSNSLSLAVSKTGLLLMNTNDTTIRLSFFLFEIITSIQVLFKTWILNYWVLQWIIKLALKI